MRGGYRYGMPSFFFRDRCDRSGLVSSSSPCLKTLKMSRREKEEQEDGNPVFWIRRRGMSLVRRGMVIH